MSQIPIHKIDFNMEKLKAAVDKMHADGCIDKDGNIINSGTFNEDIIILGNQYSNDRVLLQGENGETMLSFKELEKKLDGIESLDEVLKELFPECGVVHRGENVRGVRSPSVTIDTSPLDDEPDITLTKIDYMDNLFTVKGPEYLKR